MNLINKKSFFSGKYYLMLAIFVLSAVFCVSFNRVLAQEEEIEFSNISIDNIDKKTVKVKWDTNINTKGKIIYGKSADSLSGYLIDSKEGLKNHELIIGNLESETNYYFQIIASNNASRVSSFIQSFKTEKYNDEMAPVISDFKVAYLTGTLAVITWDTNEDSNSVVEYDQNGTYKKNVNSRYMVKHHEIILRNLVPGIEYFARAYSTDKDKNRSDGSYKKFKTSESDNIDKDNLYISNIRPNSLNDSNLFSNKIVLSFKTNHYAKGKVSLKGANSKTQNKDLAYGVNHEIIFADLESDSEYVLSISMTDVFNKKADIKNVLIKTKKVDFGNSLIEDYPINYGIGDIIVEGAEFSYNAKYTKSKALYRANNSSDIYALLNGKKHYISSPASFNEYGYDWNNIKTISGAELDKYPRVKLIKSPDNPTIYYLYQRQEKKWLKINIPSPTVFVSYPDNSWGDVVVVNDLDINSYPDAKLIRQLAGKNNSAVYYLENNEKRFVSEEIFKRYNFNPAEIVEVSEAHLNAYKTGESLK